MRYPSPSEVGAASALATMGALPLGQVPEDESSGSPTAYAVGSVAGAGLGGGIVGFAAAGDARGAAVGSLLTAGLSSMAVAFSRMKTETTQRGPWIGLGIGGLFGVGAAIYLAGGRR